MSCDSGPRRSVVRVDHRRSGETPGEEFSWLAAPPAKRRAATAVAASADRGGARTDGEAAIGVAVADHLESEMRTLVGDNAKLFGARRPSASEDVAASRLGSLHQLASARCSRHPGRPQRR
jgi:hypothetical protein